VTDEFGSRPAGPTQAGARRVITFFCVLITLASMAWAMEFYRSVGLLLFNEQLLAVFLGIALALVFLNQPAVRGKPRGKVPWYDWILATAGLFACGYLSFAFPRLTDLITERPADGLVVAFVVIPLVIEGLRRTTGWALTSVALVFLAYALVGDLVPGALRGRPVTVPRLAYYLVWDSGSMLGTPVLVAATIVIAFIFFGQLLFASGGSAFFTDISLALMGRFRGGSAKIAVTASSLFGMISGSAVSNVTSTGVITIPLMRRGGYPAHAAAAIEAVASTGGQLMPPVMGAAAFLMAEFLQVPYRDVAIAAVVPSVLYYFALFVQADLLAGRLGIKRVDASEIPKLAGVLKRGWHFLLPFAVLVHTLFWMNWPPDRAALAASAVLVVTGSTLGYGTKRLGLADIGAALRGTGLASLDLFMITAAAGFIIGVLNISALGFSLTLLLVKIGGGHLMLLLLLSALVSIVLGMGMPTVGVYVLLATLVAPALVQVGVTPMAAHLFVLYFGMMSMITPPVAIAAYAAASLTQTDPMKTGWTAMRFGWVAYIVPFLFVGAPSLLLDAPLPTILVALATAFVGVWMVSAAFVGYWMRPIRTPMRLGLGVAGLLLFIPAGAIPYGAYTDSLGLAIGVIVIAREFLAVRLKRRTAAEPSA